MKLSYLLVLATLSGCTTLTYREGGVEFSRTSWFTNLQISELSVTVDTKGVRRARMTGYVSDQVEIARAVAEGVAKGLKP